MPGLIQRQRSRSSPTKAVSLSAPSNPTLLSSSPEASGLRTYRDGLWMQEVRRLRFSHRSLAVELTR